MARPRPTDRRRTDKPGRAKISLARALSKLGYTSRSDAVRLIEAGRVRVNGRVYKEPDHRIDIERDRVEVDKRPIEKTSHVYVMLNKPRGLVTTRQDEHGRGTVYDCLEGGGFPYLAPVGRLDKESEGLLLFSNDTRWANSITAPESEVEKTYRAEIAGLAGEDLIQALITGVIDRNQHLAARRAKIVRTGESTSWIEIVLDEGKNRHIRRLLSQLGVEVLRLKRVAIGKVKLGGLGEGKFRELTADERRVLGA